MRVERLGANSLIIRDLDEPAAFVAKRLRDNLPNIQDATPCYDTVALYMAGLLPTESLITEILSAHPRHRTFDSRLHSVPVCYELGEDLDLVSKELGISTKEVVEIHQSTVYECMAVGFMPGFAYLAKLDDRIAGISRLPSPRVRVPTGSVAVNGLQTAVYPVESPGGWKIIGRCPLELSSVNDRYFPVEVGDRIQFYQVDLDEFEVSKGQRL